jgi:hypothetical protein
MDTWNRFQRMAHGVSKAVDAGIREISLSNLRVLLSQTHCCRTTPSSNRLGIAKNLQTRSALYLRLTSNVAGNVSQRSQ